MRAPAWLFAVLGLFLAGATALASAFAVRSFMGEPIVEGGEAVLFYGLIAIYILIDLFLLVNFTNLSVSVSGAGIELRFGLFSKTISMTEITAVEPKDYSWASYGGWGLRLALGGRRAWSMLGVPRGVLVSVGDKSYFVSSRKPEVLAQAISGAISAV